LPRDVEPLGIAWDVTLDRAAAEVFRALVEPEKIRAWNAYVGAAVRVEPRVGGRYSFGWAGEATDKDGPGEIVRYEEGQKLTYTWHGSPNTLVSWEVEPLPGPGPKTRVRFTHSGFVKDPDIVWEYRLGWAAFLLAFAAAVTGRRPVREVAGFLRD
jgi:uncharacterized protein YndB with AHSA1/START domain